MKIIITQFLFLILTIVYSQENNNLLLLKITTHRDLQIDKSSTDLLVIELDENYKVIKGEFSKPVFIDNFTDSNMYSCIKKDSVKILTFNNSETFEQINKIGNKNIKNINKNIDKMRWLMDIKLKSKYIKKIEIHYTLIKAKCCTGIIAKKDSEMLNYNGKIALILSELIIDNNYLIPKDDEYDIIKAIDFNYFLY